MSAQSFADPKPWADFRLRRTKNFNLSLPAFGEGVSNRLKRELRRIAIAAQVSEDDPVDFSRQQFLDHPRRRGVGQMSVAGLDPLLHRPRAMSVILQKLFIMIGLDHKGVDLPQPFHDHFGRVAEIGDKTESARSRVERETRRIDSVMRDGKRLDGNVANLEFRSGAKDSPVRVLIQRTTVANSLRGLRVRVNRNVEFATEDFETANMVSVLVSQQDAIELLRKHAALLEPQSDLTRAKSAIDQNFAMVGPDQSAVSATAAPEHRQTKHAVI